jgi:2-polyprenyl-3-methyl-5-hydroxy-6-metoxy-1,4-benzoquinol methylase
MLRYVICDLCEQNNTEVIQKAEAPFQIVRCKECGLVYVDPQPARDFMSAHYSEDYYKEWIETQMDRRIPMWRKRLKKLLKYKIKGRLLDVGFGCGTFLKLAKERGFDVHGTEISEYACQYVKDKLGLDVFCGDLKKARFPGESFDVTTVWHTLEHLPSPSHTLEEIHRILRKDGLLVVAVPNLNNFITRILYFLVRWRKLKLFSVKAKELHLYHFSISTLTALLEKTGFQIQKIELDLAQIEPPKKIVDILTRIIYFFSRRNFGEAMKVYAVKAAQR